MSAPDGEPVRPADSDEAAHERTGEALWNESWYFDFADTAGGVGGWIRLGLYPNEDRAWINALLCGPDRPTIALNDFHVASPGDPTDVRTAGITLTQEVVEPLQTYRVTVTGRGQSYDDPAVLLAGGRGRPNAPTRRTTSSRSLPARWSGRTTSTTAPVSDTAAPSPVW